MPLTPVYTWHETDTKLYITIDNVPIKDHSQIFCSDKLVKLNTPPYLLVLDLKHAVDDDQSTAAVHSGRKIVLQLVKTQPGFWGSLTSEGDKHSIKQARDESVQRAHAKQVAAHKQRQERKQKEERAAIDRQIAQERAQRDRIDALKQHELDAERQQLQQWQNKLPERQQPLLGQQSLGIGDESEEEDTLDRTHQQHVDAKKTEHNRNLQNSSAGWTAEGSRDSSTGAPDHPAYYGKGWWPSKAANADDNREPDAQQGAQQAYGVSAADSRQVFDATSAGIAAAESDNMLLTAVSAIHIGDAASSNSSYSRLEQGLSSSFPADTRIPQHPDNDRVGRVAGQAAVAEAPKRPLAPVRCRAEPVAITFTQLQMPHLPAREQREIEIKRIKRQAQNDSVDVSDRQPAFLKDKGDALAAQGNFKGAINAYTRALELDLKQPSLWSNRSACYLELGQAADCIQDCNMAIQLLQQLYSRLLEEDKSQTAAAEVAAGMLPTAASLASSKAIGFSADSHSAGSAAPASSHDDSNKENRLQSDNMEITAVCEYQARQLQQNKQATAARVTVQQQQQQHDLASGEAAVATPAVQIAMPAEAEAMAPALTAAGGVAVKLQAQLVKVLARRAAAHVELQQLQEAAGDLQEALRLAPGNAKLQADALEVAAALNPASKTDIASLKKRAQARFNAGDVQGAGEAYTAMIQLLQQQLLQQVQLKQLECTNQHAAVQQQAQQQQDNCISQEQLSMQLLAALSNRASCWLSKEEYKECLADCRAALALAVGSAADKGWCPRMDGSINSEDNSPAGGETSEPNRLGQKHKQHQDRQKQLDHQGVLALLQQHPSERLLALHGPARVRSVARLLGRMAVACECLKDMETADQMYSSAQGFWQAVGDVHRAAELAADQARLQQLQGS